MREFEINKIAIKDGFWNPRLTMNAERAIVYQWEQLEKTGNIDNFRIAARLKDGFRYGFFYSDSDATKWLDAASRVLITQKSPTIMKLVDDFINLVEKSQEKDGYLYTYNQILFPHSRWENIQIEHELYSLGHLIEAGVYHYIATKSEILLNVAKLAADLVYDQFMNKGSKGTPGHQEIEIALLMLYRITHNEKYFDIAEYLLLQRGNITFFGFTFLLHSIRTGKRMKNVQNRKNKYLSEHPDAKEVKLPDHVKMDMPKSISLRSLHVFFSGKYNQQHIPILKQKVPEGHAVRFVYQEAAAAMLCRERENNTLLDALKSAWDHMVKKRMFVTGGIGSIPIIEGFGYDYELNPFYAYCETCAALGCLFWNWEMLMITMEPKYADLFEWQLYNAASVGIAESGNAYLYRNPLASKGTLVRESWYATPCCPSNISRTWASLGKYLTSYDEEKIWIHQFIGSSMNPDLDSPLILSIDSKLPYGGTVKISIDKVNVADSELFVRIPSWTEKYWIQINSDENMEYDNIVRNNETASGYNPYNSSYHFLKKDWKQGDMILIEFSMPIRSIQASPKVKDLRGIVAISRGPLVYCAELQDNPTIDIFAEKIDSKSLHDVRFSEFQQEIIALEGNTSDGNKIILIPYYLWGNRKESTFSVHLKV